MARLYAKLKLKVNEEKSTVARVWERKFLGYSFWVAPGKLVKRRFAPKALEGLKERIREITSRNGGRSLEKVIGELRWYLLGWMDYFRLADTPGIFEGLDQWIARRLRMVQLKQWKRGTTVYRELRRRGVPERVSRAAAAHARSWWRIANHGALKTAMPTTSLEDLGVVRLAPH
jgi:RNA-directed DNA polymerase